MLLGTVQYAYDASQLTSVTDELNRTTTFGYDLLGRNVSLADAVSSTTSDYDDAGNLVLVTAAGLETAYEYDFLNRLTSVAADPNGINAVQSYVYDAASRLTSETDAENHTTAYGYDNLDRTITVTLPGGRTTSYEYDPAGNPTKVIDPLNHAVEYQYDALNRQISTTDPLGTTEYEYDPVGNMTSLTDPVGNETMWAYDALDRVESETNSLQKTRTFTWDAEGNLKTATDRKGRLTEHTYDNIGRLKSEVWKDAGGTEVNTVDYVWDAASRLENASDDFSHYTYQYDFLDRVTQVDNTLTPNVPDVVLTSTYDAASRRTGLSANINGTADFTNTYTFDDLSRVTQITQADGSPSEGYNVSNKRVDLTYNQLGQFETITRYESLDTSELVATSTYGYQAATGRLESLDHTQGATTFAAYGWQYDDADRITQFTSPDGTSNFGYDNADQLTSASLTNESYSYDDNGNRTNAGYQTGLNNRLLADGSALYAYDDEGNRTAKMDVGGGDRVDYGWDHRNRLTSVVFTGGRLSGAYAFNGQATAVQQDGDRLVFRNEAGSIARGSFLDLDTVIASDWNNITGELVGGQIVWSNGSTWTRDLAGDWEINGLATQVTQTGASLTFTNENGGQSSGYFADVRTVVAVDWGYLEGTLSNGRIDWANGTVWETDGRFTIAGWYTFNSPQNPQAHIGQRGGELEFVNEAGQHSDGGFLDADTVVATDWNNITGELAAVPGEIVWSNGSVWTRDLDGTWFFNGQETTIQQTGVSLLFFNENGSPSVGHFVDIDTVEADDWGDLGGILAPGEIAWLNNTTWTRDEPVPDVGIAARKEVQYTYDVYDRLILKEVNDQGNAGIDRAESYVYDGDDVVASFDAAGSLTHRYLHGPAVDQIFADEDALAEILWGLGDNQGTVRDVVDYDPVSDTTTIANHRSYDSFGNITAESDPSLDYLFAWTGRYFDEDTGQQNNGARWYDAPTARWMSEDWILDDTNSYRYVRNNPVNLSDPSGLAPPESEAGFWRKVHQNVRFFSWVLSTQKDRIPQGVGPYVSPKNVAIDALRDTMVGVSAARTHIAISCENGLLDPEGFFDKQKAFALGATSSFPTVRSAASLSDVLSPGAKLYGGSSVLLDRTKAFGAAIDNEAAELGSEAATPWHRSLLPSRTAARASHFGAIVTLVSGKRQDEVPRRSAKRGCGGSSGCSA